MNRRALALCLAALVGAAGCSHNGATAADRRTVGAVDDALARLPGESIIVVGLNVKQLYEAPLSRRLFDELVDKQALGDTLQRLGASCGFQVGDVQSLILGVAGPDQIAGVARGALGPAKGDCVRALLVADGREAWLASTPDLTFVASSEAWLTTLLDAAAPKARANAAVAAVVAKAALGRSVWWAVAIDGSWDIARSLAQESRGAIAQPPTQLYGSAQFGERVDLEVHLVFASSHDADGFVRLARTSIDNVRQRSPKPLGQLLGDLQLSRDGADVRARIVLDATTLELVTGML